MTGVSPSVCTLCQFEVSVFLSVSTGKKRPESRREKGTESDNVTGGWTTRGEIYEREVHKGRVVAV